MSLEIESKKNIRSLVIIGIILIFISILLVNYSINKKESIVVHKWRFISITGDVKIKKDRAPKWQPANSTIIPEECDLIETKSNSTATIECILCGDKIKMSSDSMVRLEPKEIGNLKCTFIFMEGDVQIKKAESYDWQIANRAIVLQEQDLIMIRANGYALVECSNGRKATIEHNSLVEIETCGIFDVSVLHNIQNDLNK